MQLTDVRDVAGNAAISTSFASANVSNIRGALDLTSANGNVVVTEAGPTSIRTSFASPRWSADIPVCARFTSGSALLRPRLSTAPSSRFAAVQVGHGLAI